MRNTLYAAKIAANAVLAALGLAVLIASIGYGFVDEVGYVGPGVLPGVSGGLVLVFALFGLVTIRRERARERARSAAPVQPDGTAAVDKAAAVDEGTATDEGTAVDVAALMSDVPDIDIFGRSQKQRAHMLWVVIGLFVVTVLLVPLLGFVISFGLLIFACAFWVEKRRLVPSVVITVCAMAFAYLIFGVLLDVPLPQGLLGIL